MHYKTLFKEKTQSGKTLFGKAGFRIFGVRISQVYFEMGTSIRIRVPFPGEESI